MDKQDIAILIMAINDDSSSATPYPDDLKLGTRNVAPHRESGKNQCWCRCPSSIGAIQLSKLSRHVHPIAIPLPRPDLASEPSPARRRHLASLIQQIAPIRFETVPWEAANHLVYEGQVGLSGA